MLSILSIVVIVIFSLFRRKILYTAFDSEFAKIRQLPVKLVKYGTMMFIAIVLLMIANFLRMIYLSVLIGFVLQTQR